MATAKIEPHMGLDWWDWVWAKPRFYREQGVDVLALKGAPRDDPAPHVLEASQRAAAHNADIDERGTQEFRDAIAAKLNNDHGVELDSDTQILVTNGGMNAVFIALASLLGADDEVIIASPHFYYWNTISILNGRTVFAPRSEKDAWVWDFDAIDDAVTPNTRAFLYTNPCNPTGFMPDENHLTRLGEIAERHDLVVIEDQAYAGVSHIERPIISALTIPGLRDRTVIAYTFTKNYSMHAWRIGFLAGPARLIEACLSVAVWMNLRVNHISQAAATAALNGPQEWMAEILRPYTEGRNLILKELAEDPGIRMAVPAQGSTNGLLNVTGCGSSAEDVAELLISKYGVTTTPGPVFGPMRDSGDQLRISLALESVNYPRPYQEVVNRLKAASAELRGVEA